ncbi:OLC1v1002825C1 [Oldenlandia corymbosa var. corymbosa]|uniref:OLC1v1002825C1 n=1 Tax=Oldenlandia corymbosa var. corymbosa TaxID=529605 RepID=A0AAV1DAA5_OLDCO|nr:OLC1v1002825C1 [Oldenlandia corymbosa var. corymbosa]
MYCNRKLTSFKLDKLIKFKFFSASSAYLAIPQHISFDPKPISESCTEEDISQNQNILYCLVNHPNPEVAAFPYKGFSKITDHLVGRALHGILLKDPWQPWTYSDLSVLHLNTLINMYAKLGRIKEARHVFDEMSDRNGSSLNNMVSGYVRLGYYMDALLLFAQMWGRGVELSGFLVASLLTAFCRSKNMALEGFQIHSLGLKTGLLDDVYVGTSLMHFYGGYGFLTSAQKLFEDIPERNVVSWTSFMVGCSDNGDNGMVIDAYRRMRHEGIGANQNTFTTVICSSCALGDEFLGHQVLGQVIKSGLEDNTSVANSLVSIFGTFGRLEEACSVFHKLDDRDTISWNSILAAFAHNSLHEQSFKCFEDMRHDHGDINSITLSTLVSVSSSPEYLKWGRGIHGLAVKMGLDSVVLNNTLLTMYSETGRSEEAESLFNGMRDKDLISWNSLMAGYVSKGRSVDALRLLTFLLGTKKYISYVTFTSALAACSNPEFVLEGKAVHALALVFGFQENLIVGNALVTMYGRSGAMLHAKQVFQTMPEKELVTWNALIGGYSENEEPDQALKAFKLMLENGELPNYITMTNILGACSAPPKLQKLGLPLHAYIVQMGFETDEYVKNSLITMYANCGDLNSSKSIFEELINKTSATWSAMVAANAHQGYGEEALKLLLEMQRAKVDFDQFSLSASLAVSADLASLEEGKQLHGLAIKLGFHSYHYVENSVMDMYGKCGELDDVLKLLPEPPTRSRLSWNILISSFARHGHFQKAIQTFQDMLTYGSKPDHVSFVSLLSACSHGGLVDEGRTYFNRMTTEFGVIAEIPHCVCIVDLLGRSGRLAEAEAFIEKMPVPPNDYIWRSLLAASRIHGNMDMGEKAAKRLLEYDPSDDSAYVLYSNVCSASGKWQDAQNVWLEMETNSVMKKPACSWVKTKAEVSTFAIGDRSHPKSEQIYMKLAELRRKINEAGYVADTSFALHDTDEEQKEHNLWNHSERLALAYGLISTPEGSTLRVFKNLRVCGDCHSVFKLASSILQREVILRDSYRFHHFKNGACSCGDYW